MRASNFSAISFRMFSTVLITNSTGTHREAALLEVRKRPKEMVYVVSYIDTRYVGRWAAQKTIIEL